jgi:hypothetical protein
MTWDRQLYFPSEGRHAGDFFAQKNLMASAGFEPANLGTRGQHASSRPPKQLVCDCVWSVGGMMEIGENLITWRKSSACVNMSHTNPTCAGLWLYLDPHCGRLVTNDSNRGMPVTAVDIGRKIR